MDASNGLTLNGFVEWFDRYARFNMSAGGAGQITLRHRDPHFLEQAMQLLGLNHKQVHSITCGTWWSVSVSSKRDLLTLIAAIRPFTRSRGAALDYVRARCEIIVGRQAGRGRARPFPPGVEAAREAAEREAATRNAREPLDWPWPLA